MHYFTLFTFFVYYAHGLALPPLLCRQEKSYTWPGSIWRPSACEADVIATRPQVLLPLVAPALRPGETNMLGSSPCVFLVSHFSPRCQDLTQAAACQQAVSWCLIHLFVCQHLCNIYAEAWRPVSRACGVVVSHPLRMRKALGSIPSRSNCPNHTSLLTSNVMCGCCASPWHSPFACTTCWARGRAAAVDAGCQGDPQGLF